MNDDKFKVLVLKKLNLLLGIQAGFRNRIAENERRLDSLEQWRSDSSRPTIPDELTPVEVPDELTPVEVPHPSGSR
jgi:hypothetical protein